MSDPIFEEWKRLTRWWNCMLTAAARERSYWIGAGIKEPKSTELILSHRSNSKFRISVDNYTAVLNDPSMTASLALLMSWGLLEQRGRRALRLNDSDQLPQIEDWGRRVLAGRDATWSQVFGGRKGLVEVAVIRNAVAHGNHRITQRMLNRVQVSVALFHGVTGRQFDSTRTLSRNTETESAVLFA